ncbi:MAG TPA: ribonuclease H [Saprospirales bacterium]|nr:ribonuclease H [Saprospirales bacterium]
MGKAKKKFYVVWIGAKPGIYDSWEACKSQVSAFPDAKFKAFDTIEEARFAYKKNFKDFYQPKQSGNIVHKKWMNQTEIIKDSLAVDAACGGNPGTMEYRGIDLLTGQIAFHQGPFAQATNNIGEFLAIVHALAFLQKKGETNRAIYSDSKTAISWVKLKNAKTKLEKTRENEAVFELIDRAVQWLKTNSWDNPVLKWETEKWGEIPADFGRK